MIVTGDRLALDADDGVAGFGSGTAGSVVDSLAGGTGVFAEIDPAGAGRVDAAVRFVAFTTGGFFALSVSDRVLTAGRVATAGGRRAGASVLGDEYRTSAALALYSVSCCWERALSFVGGHRGTAIVAITTTAIPATNPICLPVVCHGGVACITGAATVVGVDSTAGGEARTGDATGTAVVVF